jgi:glycosyltransferase 2 family protein
VKRSVSILVSLIILAIIYARIDVTALMGVFAGCDVFYMALSLLMVVPLTLFTAWRLNQLVPMGCDLGFVEANRLILAASSLNMVLPSKMGDIAKAYFMQDRGRIGGTLSLLLVIFEKACDMLSLLLWCIFGLAF